MYAVCGSKGHEKYDAHAEQDLSILTLKLVSMLLAPCNLETPAMQSKLPCLVLCKWQITPPPKILESSTQSILVDFLQSNLQHTACPSKTLRGFLL